MLSNKIQQCFWINSYFKLVESIKLMQEGRVFCGILHICVKKIYAHFHSCFMKCVFSMPETLLCTFTVTQFWSRLILLKLELLKEAWFQVLIYELRNSWWKAKLVMHGCVHALLGLQSMKLMTLVFKIRVQRQQKN